jgi:hypothetical protein
MVGWSAKRASIFGSISGVAQSLQPLPLPSMGHESGCEDDDDETEDRVAVTKVDGGLVIPDAAMELFLKGIDVVLIEVEVACKDVLEDVPLERLFALSDFSLILDARDWDLVPESSPEVAFGVLLGFSETSGLGLADLLASDVGFEGVFDDTLSDGVGFADLSGRSDASGVDLTGAFDEALFDEVGLAVLLDTALDGFAGVAAGFFGFGVGFNVRAGFDDFGFGFGVLLAFGGLLLGFFDLLFGGLGSATSPGFALSAPNARHLENKSHSFDCETCQFVP